jgi:hypothetical protein
LTQQQQSQLVARSARCNVISSDNCISGFTWNDVTDRLLDLEGGIKTFEEYIHLMRRALTQLKNPDGILGDFLESQDTQLIDELIDEMARNHEQFFREAEEYRTSLYASNWGTDELLEEYENINTQILTVSEYTKVMQQIHGDLPGLVKRLLQK